MSKKLSSSIKDGIRDDDDHFTMSTSSYLGAVAGSSNNYFVTKVEDSNFTEEPTSTTGNYVTVYVERLAAKVTVSVGSSLTPTTIGSDIFYKIQATVAGADNSTSSGSTQIAAEDLYIKLIGWNLNATAKSSYIVKNIKDWNDENLGFTWNNDVDHRSFWGKSFNYGENIDYPTSVNDISESIPLNYSSLAYVKNLGTGFAYCAENTNTPDILNNNNNFPTAVTSVLLKAKICDKNGNALDLVRFNDVLFKQDTFIQYILNVLEAKEKVRIKEGTDYRKIKASDVELVNNFDGNVKVQLLTTTTIDLYKEKASGYDDIDKDYVNGVLATECSNGSANGYKGGLMYYNIPIEHLNSVSGTLIAEAQYGVVRNHCYKITIDKIEKIGKGIWEEDEVIVPDKDKDTYYVGATINILSWRIVSHGVSL